MQTGAGHNFVGNITSAMIRKFLKKEFKKSDISVLSGCFSNIIIN